MKKSVLLLTAALLGSSAMFAAPQSVVYAPGLKAFPGSGTGKSVVNLPMREGEENGDSETTEEESLVFSYAEAQEGAYWYGDESTGQYIYLAFKMPVADQAPYIGCKISAINVMTGTNGADANKIAKVDVFVTESATTIPEEMTNSKLPLTAFTVVPIELENPYTITGENDIYIGYRFKFLSAPFYYMVTDNIVTNQQTCLWSRVANSTKAPSYQNLASQIGSLCLSCTITGENLPVNIAKATDINLLAYQTPEQDFSYDLVVKNFGANDVTSLTVKTEVSNGVSTEAEITLPTPIASGEVLKVTVPNIPNLGFILNNELTSTIVKVNGVDVESPIGLTASFDSYYNPFERRIVIEEGTGVKCGWCPRGIVMMECIKENFPEWIRIVVHGAYGADPMKPASYVSMMNKYLQGAPTAVTNRIYDTDVIGYDLEYYGSVYNYFTCIPTYLDINMEAAISEDETTVNVNATTEFSYDIESQKLGFAFVLVEDNIGPYNQTNYYSGGSYGEMDGWESLSSSVPTMYEDVARYLDGYPAIANSIPTSVVAGEEYGFERAISLETVTGDAFRLVGLVVNTQTGEILNARELSMSKSAAKGICDDPKVDIKVVNGEIVVEGAKNVSIFTLDGRKVSASNLGKGVYIVTADGVSTKVFVK